MLASSGEITEPCPVPFSLTVTTPSSSTPAFNHFLDQADDARITDPMLDKADQPALADFVEKGSDIRIKNEVHLLVGDPDRQSVQRIVLAALRPEAVAEPEELFLVDAVRYRTQAAGGSLLIVTHTGNCAMPVW